ncbi:MAG: DNA mismatch repair protein MutS [Paludibacteraceae bacterium]|nr:DNA mismatch repair protein MutS [Paludibacteraceae bacterium]MBR1480942.1 DNA mismatch repair protein MutS [Paludibacteraceae bacterium]
MNAKETPMMEQFRKIKEQYPDAMLLFRCGDFYETYCEDAVRAAKVLGITLTKRNNGGTTSTEMAGFPFHALDTYLPKLVRAGMRVAICDQLEDPKLTKKLVKRGVTELVTPGVSYSDTTLTQKENNFVACLFTDAKSRSARIGLSLLDISTGEFLVAEGSDAYVDKLLINFAPKEVLFLRGQRPWFEQHFSGRWFTFELEDWMLTGQAANDRLTRQFGTTNLKGFGVDRLPLAVIAAGGILHYLDATQHLLTGHIQHLSRIEEDRYVWLDRFTVRNLELLGGQREDSRTLYDILDRTSSPMGARMLHRWIALPLKSTNAIRNRQSVVNWLFRHPDQRDTLRDALARVQDMERIVSKIATGRISPREMVQLAVALQQVQTVRTMCEAADDNDYMMQMAQELNPCETERERISRTITPNPPAAQGRPGIIANGIDTELDELRDIQSGGKQYLFALQQREAEATGIQSLKIGFNNVFGYYLEVRNTYRDQVPETWIRKQTLVNAERYITQELKEYEDKILTAEEKIQVIENRLYAELMLALQDLVPAMQRDATVLAQLDCLLSFALVAADNRYVCPEVNDSLIIDIRQGRHPVIEQQLPRDEKYVPNDILLDNNSQQIIIITGPNMAGKSALLRQTALIVLMAQIGSFVPAESASIGVVDKIFTRVGASDNISMGESTFMVEMNEAASILNNLSERSLVLFDELGRGTSTYDGISIAWAIVEYIHENRGHAKTLFATHYHELNEMEGAFKRIRNYNVSVREVKGKVLFLRKLVRGGSEHSFGIHVARLAGMPASIVKRAEQVLAELEKQNADTSAAASGRLKQSAAHHDGLQLSFFQLDDPVLEQVRDEVKQLDLNNITPLEALNRLSEIQRLVLGR